MREQSSVLDVNRPVLILGAGINGLSVARELLLNGASVVVVDSADVGFGATSKSSRLIHGGLRYLEYGDFGLVRESLHERERMLRLAPQFVRPLRLHIPVRRRTGGFLASGIRFAGLQKWPGLGQLERWSGSGSRGLVTVESGLRFYDMLSGESSLPQRSRARVGPTTVPVDSREFPWICSYSDAQMLFPERYVLAIIEDCRRIAETTGARFEILTYHRSQFVGNRIELKAVLNPAVPVKTVEPVSIVNATGAWGDLTLSGLAVPAARMFGGTKGSHILTSNRRLRDALKGDGIYAEAGDGRLVFILPQGADGVMIGTTDERWEGRPEDVYATPDEVAYLVRMTNEVFPQVSLTSRDIDATYCGVRPLPYVAAGKTGSIPRGHWVESIQRNGLWIETLVGGKLTTCRALGEDVARRVLERGGNSFVPRTQERPVPGAEGFPTSAAARSSWTTSIANRTGWTAETIADCTDLLGTQVEKVLDQIAGDDRSLIPGTHYPRSLVHWMIRFEEVRTLEDLVERRLMLAFAFGVNRETIETVSDIWQQQSGRDDLDACLARLRKFYGRSF